MTENNTEKNNRYWKVEEIRPYIMKYLKEKFPDSIIMREFDKVDIMIIGENIPVEIQTTRTDSKGRCVSMASFEDLIRRQIEQNIEIYNKCWFFFDEKFLNYLQNNLHSHVSMNMDWLYQLYKSGKLTVFTITLDGNIRKLTDNDFNFISKFSSTCNVSKNEDYRILERNKVKIAYRVFIGYGFDTDNISLLYEMYLQERKKNNDNSMKFVNWLKGKENREKILGYCIISFNNLRTINDMIDFTLIEGSGTRNAMYSGSALGLINGNKKNDRSTPIRIIDKYNILEYFPAYHRHRKEWDYMKEHVIPYYTFISVICGKSDFVKEILNRKTLFDY